MSVLSSLSSTSATTFSMLVSSSFSSVHLPHQNLQLDIQNDSRIIGEQRPFHLLLSNIMVVPIIVWIFAHNLLSMPAIFVINQGCPYSFADVFIQIICPSLSAKGFIVITIKATFGSKLNTSTNKDEKGLLHGSSGTS